MKTKEQFIEEAKAMMKVRGGCKPFCLYCEKWANDDTGSWYCCALDSELAQMRVYCTAAAKRWAEEITE